MENPADGEFRKNALNQWKKAENKIKASEIKGLQSSLKILLLSNAVALLCIVSLLIKLNTCQT